MRHAYHDWTNTHCTLCSAEIPLDQTRSEHYLSLKHQRCVREWDALHQQPRTHHDFHVLLKIACTCEQALAA